MPTKRVCEYPVAVATAIKVHLPDGAQVLRFDLQADQLCLWALVDSDKPSVMYQFRMVGTGDPLDTVGAYINSIFVDEARLIYHFFHA